jgi:transcriptional regulator with PAS, ATPase and Fis domain
MIIAADAEVIRAEHAPAELRSGGPETGSSGSGDRRSFQEQREYAERQIVLGALERNQGRVTKTAEELGLADHASLLKIMRRLGIEREK